MNLATTAFLFTDIEGSTARWERDRDAMSAAVQRHNSISRTCVESSGGQVFKLTGDGVCAAFPGVDAALEAARCIHDRLEKEPWPGSIDPVKVRAGIHVGTVEERENDYYGPAVNRVARLMSAGHGGQTLLSGAAQELADAGPAFVDLGEHRLRDLLEPVRIFQYGRSEFPALRTLDARRHNLPIQVTTFVGRADELEEVGDLLDSARLLTLVGPGGTGKTRLALEVAALKLDSFDSAYFVDLANVTTADAVVAAIGDTMRISLSRVDDEVAALSNSIGAEKVLLILDNFEHVMGAAPAVGRILASTSGVDFLVTSRELLRIRAERGYPVSPLDLPSEEEASVTSVTDVEAVKLFVDRARAVVPDFDLTAENVGDVVGICRRLDGLPLAIELAAARLRIFKPSELRSALDADRPALGTGPRDAPERQQTLQGAVRWSIDLLSEEERQMMLRLSVFVGGASIDAALRVATAGSEDEAFEVLEALVDKSLVRIDRSPGEETRLHMLQTIRDVALAELRASGGLEVTRLAHATYYAELAERAEPELRQKSQSDWIRTLDREWGNLEAAMKWSFDGGDPIPGLRLVSALRDFWFYSGRYRPMGRWCSVAVDHVEEADDLLRAGVYLAAGFHAYGTYDEGAIELLDEAVRGYRDSDDLPHLALALLWRDGALRQFSDEGSEEGQLEEAISVARQSGAMHIVSQALNMWGEMEREEGNYEAAREVQEEALELATEIGERLRVAMLLNNLGLIAHHLGDDAKAKRLIFDSLKLANELGVVILVAHSLIAYSEQLAIDGSPEEAAQLIGAADSFFDEQVFRPQPSDAPDFERIKKFVRDSLGDEAYEAGREEGALMGVEAVTERVLEAGVAD